MRLVGAIAAIAAAFFAFCAAAHAQAYPTRVIRVVVGYPAGSGGDVIARFYADQLSKICGQPVIVEDKPGMISSAAADAVAKSPPDGYTILITSVSSSHAANLFNFKKLPYDPIKDFSPVATLHKSYFVLMVRAQAPWKSVAELTEALRQKGNKGSYGYGSPPALAAAELYKVHAGLETVGIPYKTSMASLPEMFSGELDFQFIDATAGMPLIEGGKLRGLAVTSGRRVPNVDIPTMAEAANIPEFDIAPVWGVFLPAGAPAPIVTQLESWFAEIMRRDATRKFLTDTHGAAFPGGAKALAALIPVEIKKWEALAKLAKIEPQ
ncbi:MAG TPA: tripartite tricarboxylate transporter substrate binding protein [Xanthobacteraceae bacterium]|nr:tripartite tricarboxylate transporter substrate binding protein [Xanthobacteraceae bacterium]